MSLVSRTALCEPQHDEHWNKQSASKETSPLVRRDRVDRKALTDTGPTLLAALDDLVSPEARGDPTSPLR
ncbi:MAG: hypothetical protein ACLPUG_17895 [Acidimicrobiales bacterium]